MVQTTPTLQTEKSGIWSVITASSVGTLIEWYDFYIFGSLAAIISTQFFPDTNPTVAFLATLATFAAGFVVRPFGALVFGRLGDIVGRKYTFLLTLILMGGSTFLIGLIPGYKVWGFASPMLVLILRLIQGLALGGEYGGAATYVAEHAPAHRRGFYTSWIQTTATLGLFVSLGVILAVREVVGVKEFTEGIGWRIPFLLSIVLVIVSIFIRLRMNESPLFAKLKSEGKTSSNPLKESFGNKNNLKMVLLTLFGATAGQGVIFYTSQFYSLSFLQRTCYLEFEQANLIVIVALAFSTPFFVIFGGWSDKVGRKFIMMAGMLLAVLGYRPIYEAMFNIANLKIKTEVAEQTSIQTNKEIIAGTTDSLTTTSTLKTFTDGTIYKEIKKIKSGAAKPDVKKEVTLPGGAYWMMVGLIFIQVIFVTMVYGPIAAFLVELFPTKIRYTSMSLPYHIGNGVFGGLTPFIATRLVDATRPAADTPPADPFAGLLYPILISAACFVIGMLYLSNRRDEDVTD
jgi:MFS family permease